jgi:hypothetical protein
VKATVGATLKIATDCDAVLPASLSESVACTDTVELFGPSGNVQSNEPLVFVFHALLEVPNAPQLTATELTVSTPGSEIEYVYVFVAPSFAKAGEAVNATVGATFATATTCVAVLPAAPSESVACTETVELAGPSGKVQSNEPPVFVFEAFDFVPFKPQLVATEVTVSTPGSLIEYV